MQQPAAVYSPRKAHFIAMVVAGGLAPFSAILATWATESASSQEWAVFFIVAEAGFCAIAGSLVLLPSFLLMHLFPTSVVPRTMCGAGACLGAFTAALFLIACIIGLPAAPRTSSAPPDEVPDTTATGPSTTEPRSSSPAVMPRRDEGS